MFKYQFLPESDLEKVPWVFKGELQLDMSVEDCWDIITNDFAYEVWHPEITNMKNNGPTGLGNSRTVVLRLLPAGPSSRITGKFDVWEDGDNDMKRMQCWCTASSRPQFLAYKRAREEYKVEAISGNKCIFTRTVAMDPAFLTRYGLGWAIYPMLRKTFTVKCPTRLVDAIKNKIL